MTINTLATGFSPPAHVFKAWSARYHTRCISKDVKELEGTLARVFRSIRSDPWKTIFIDPRALLIRLSSVIHVPNAFPMCFSGPKSAKQLLNHTWRFCTGEAQKCYVYCNAAVDYCGYTMFYLGGLYGFERNFGSANLLFFCPEIWSLRDVQTLPIFF